MQQLKNKLPTQNIFTDGTKIPTLDHSICSGSIDQKCNLSFQKVFKLFVLLESQFVSEFNSFVCTFWKYYFNL